MCESNSLSPKTRGRRVQAVVLSYGMQNPMPSPEHLAFCPVQDRQSPRSTAHHARSYHYLRPVPLTPTSTPQSKPIAHAPCSGLVQYIFSSPARLRSRFLSPYTYCRHAADLKMLCIVGSIRMGENPPRMSRARTALLRVMRYTSSEPRAIGARSIFDLLAGSKFINSYDTYSGPNASEWNTRSQFGWRLPTA